MLYTERPGHATQLAAQAREGQADTVLSIGGDGTNLEVARGLLGGGTALGIIPAGTGNDFVKTLGIPPNPREALDYMLSHPPRKTDVGQVNGKLFLNVIGTGFDVSVLDYAAKAKRYCRGLLPYLYGVLKTLRHFRSIRLTYTVDGGAAITRDAFVVAVANGSRFGGGIPGRSPGRAFVSRRPTPGSACDFLPGGDPVEQGLHVFAGGFADHGHQRRRQQAAEEAGNDFIQAEVGQENEP